jgi:transcriptional repressor NrdR
MMLALRKRPVSVEQVDAALERIQDKLLATALREVPSTRLGELVMRELKRIDKVAYVRFASVYREFEDVDAFRQLIRESDSTPAVVPRSGVARGRPPQCRVRFASGA